MPNKNKQKSPAKAPGITVNDLLQTGAFASMDICEVMKYMLIEICDIKRILMNCNQELSNVKRKQSAMDNSLKFLNTDVENLQKQLKEVKEEVATLKASMNQVHVKTESNAQKITSVDNYSRRICLEITEIPVTDDENCYEIAQEVFSLVGCDFPSEEISVAHRLKTSTTSAKTPPIIVRFRDIYYRNSIMNERNSNRVSITELGFDSPSDPKRQYAYINEHLSPDMKRLLYLARCRKVDKNWAKVWVHDGKILAKKTADGDRFEITQESDLKCFNKMICLPILLYFFIFLMNLTDCNDYSITHFNDKFCNNTDFLTIHFNIRSISNHFDDLSIFLESIKSTFSLIALSEIWLPSKENVQFYNIPNYNFECSLRPNSNYGGVGLYIHNSIPYKILNVNSITGSESLWLTINVEEHLVNLVGMLIS